jgi:hypothetical protein
MIAILVECTDYDTVYGILSVDDVDEETVQQKIYEIKNKFYEEGFDDWTIRDVLAKFPSEWNWEYDDQTCHKIEI